MNTRSITPSAAQLAARAVTHRTAGRGRGGITRLVSPGDLGEHIKPFIFLDHFDLKSGQHKMAMHPHSGIATVTVVMEGALEYRESTGNAGIVHTGGVEFMSAGGGVWHEGNPADGAHVRGFQLWLALPAADENGPAHSEYLAKEQVPTVGPARVVLGQYGAATSPIWTRASINYLHVKLGDGQSWRYDTPAGHDVAWVAVARGTLHTADTVIRGEVAVFDQGNSAIEFVAEGETEFVLGSAPRHPHDLVTGYYSVHTSEPALAQGEREIERLGRQLNVF